MAKSVLAIQNPSNQVPPDLDSAERAKAGRRILFLLGVALFGATTGVMLAYLPPLLVVGGLIAITSLVVVVLVPYLGLLLYTIIFLLRPAELYPVLAPLHLERIVGIITLAALLLEQRRKAHSLLVDRTRQTHLLFAFLLAVSLSVPFAYWRRLAIEGLVETLRIVAFYLMVVHLVNTRARLRLFIWTFCLLTAFLALTSLYAYVGGGVKVAQGIERAVGRTSAGGDPNQLGTTLASAFPLFLLFACSKSLRWRRVPMAIGALLLVVTMAITGSRASLIGFFGGLLCLWWLSPRRLATGVLGLVLVVVGVQLLPEQYKGRYTSITHSELDASSQSRLEAWGTGMRMVLNRPLTGVGIRCFGAAHGMDYSPESSRKWLEAHSLYVQVIAELGVFGAGIFFLLLLEMLRVNRRAAHHARETPTQYEFDTKLLDALLAGFIVLLISGLFGHSLLRRTWYMFAATGLAVLRLHLAAATIRVDQQHAALSTDASPAESEPRGT